MPNIKQPEVTIGSFQRTADVAKAKSKVDPKPAPEKKTVAPEKLETAEAELEKQVNLVENDLAPLEKYEKELKDASISKDEAATIIDDVLMQGYHSEEMQITKKISARFRSRSYIDT